MYVVTGVLGGDHDDAPSVSIVDDAGQENTLDHYEYKLVEAPKPPAAYPDDNPKSVVGATKPPFAPIPPVALIELGQAMRDGKEKYGAMNWRTSGVAASVYYDAALRHLFSWFDGEETAEDSGVHHLAHAMACLAIVLDAQHSGTLTDDRPVKGPTSKRIKELTKKAA